MPRWQRYDSQLAHPKLPCRSMLVQEEHMAQFVLHLAGTEFGARHWDRTVLASACHVLSDRRRGGNGGQRAIKVSLSPMSSQHVITDENGERDLDGE